MAETFTPDLRLRHLRQSTGQTLVSFAVEVGCSPHHLRMCEVGGRQPSIELAHRIARAAHRHLGREVGIEEFFTPRHVRQQSA